MITCKNIFAFLFTVHNIISLSCNEQECLVRFSYIKMIIIDDIPVVSFESLYYVQ